jgi:methionyl-tRNA formyltransferase
MPTADMNTVPGTIIGVSRNAIEVATGDGHLAITELQPEGKRAMAAREFLAGRAVRPGMTFLPRLPLHGSGGPG